MLYDRWRQVALERRHELALREVATRKCWTFGELLRAGEESPADPQQMIFPRTGSAQFIVQVLQAWRLGQVVCPLEAEQSVPDVPLPPAGCVHLKATSATSGAARWVAFREEQLAADCDQIVATMGLRPDWPNLGVISLAHSYGFSNLVLPLLLNGIPLILVDSPLPETVRRAVADETAITLPAVPALWQAWHEADAIPTRIKLAISAGAPLPIILEQAVWEKTGLKIHNFYGSTECGGIAFDRSAQPRSDGSCVGTAMSGVQLSLSASGQLVIHSPAVGETYWPESSSPLPSDGRGVRGEGQNRTLVNGRFETNDLAELSEGLVFLRGRSSDVINIAGRKLAPETVEHALSQHPQVRECLVFGIPSETQRTDEIAVCLTRRGPIEETELRQYLLARLPAWQVPRRWWFVESLQPNARGKLSRAEWRRRIIG